jgi:PTS system nitrogen regulatory IIA component
VRLKEYISKDLIFIIRGSADKPSFLKDLTRCIKKQLPSIDEEKLLTSLVDRESQASTGIGHGVAIPHTTLDGIEKTVCIIAKSPDGVNFESIDSTPVHLTFLLLSPPGKVGNHLRILARIARLASRKELVSGTQAARNEAEVYTSIEKEDDRHV